LIGGDKLDTSKDEKKLLKYTYLLCIVCFSNLAILKQPLDKGALVMGGVTCILIGYSYFIIRKFFSSGDKYIFIFSSILSVIGIVMIYRLNITYSIRQIIWFAVGVFPIYPSVIATGSMKPMIKPGDIILVKKIVDMDGINSLKEGDVIQFQRDSMLISHRIIEVVNDEKEGIQFITKGDNNSGEDTDFVRPEDIKGTIEQVVPKIGWVTLLIKSDKDVDLDKIEF
jgi:signal peptidase I